MFCPLEVREAFHHLVTSSFQADLHEGREQSRLCLWRRKGQEGLKLYAKLLHHTRLILMFHYIEQNLHGQGTTVHELMATTALEGLLDISVGSVGSITNAKVSTPIGNLNTRPQRLMVPPQNSTTILDASFSVLLACLITLVSHAVPQGTFHEPTQDGRLPRQCKPFLVIHIECAIFAQVIRFRLTYTLEPLEPNYCVRRLTDVAALSHERLFLLCLGDKPSTNWMDKVIFKGRGLTSWVTSKFAFCNPQIDSLPAANANQQTARQSPSWDSVGIKQGSVTHAGTHSAEASARRS